MDFAKIGLALQHIERGHVHRHLGEWDAALHEYTVSMNLVQRNFLAHVGRGLALNGKGNDTGDTSYFALAVKELTIAIAIGNDENDVLAEAYYNRGCILTDDLGKHDLALADFQKALQLVPDYHGAKQGIDRAQRGNRPQIGGY